MNDHTAEQLAAELAGARTTIDHMSKAMSWICGHDRQGLDHLEEAQYEGRARMAAVQQARRWSVRARAAEAALAAAVPVLPPVSRADVLHEAADIAESLRQFERCTGPRRAAQTSENVGILRVADHLRRMADEEQPACPGIETVPNRCRCDCEGCKHHCGAHHVGKEQPATETQARLPRRGDEFEAWLKAQRDDFARGDSPWPVMDYLLDNYRLHADTGTPLGEHVCEARVVGDCECLEAPAVVAEQPAAADTCRPVEVDGETIRVHGEGEMTEQERALFADVVRAARRKYAAEHGSEQPAAADTDEEQHRG